MLITTWEAAQRYPISLSHLRLLLRTGKVKGREANITGTKIIWLLEESSLKHYLKKERRPGPKSKRKS